MSKQEFLASLFEKLDGMPKDDVDERVSFYGEMIDDRVEEGISEDEAVAELGSADEIAFQIMSEIPLVKLVKEKVKPKRALSVWEITLLVLGSPLWLSLLIAALAVIISMYAVIWCIILSLWTTELAIGVCSLAGVISFGAFVIQGNIASGVAMLGAGLVCASITVLGFFGCKKATEAFLALTKKLVTRIKSHFANKKEAA